MKKYNPESGNMVVILLILAALIAGAVLLKNAQMQKPAPTPVSMIENDAQLQETGKELDNTNVDGTFDPELKNLSADSQAM